MKFLRFVFCLIITHNLTVRDVHVLTLDKCIDMAMELSYEMRTLREDLKQAEFQLRAATNSFKTQVNLQLMAPNYNETIRSMEDSVGVYYYPVKQREYSGTLEISQPLPTDGRIFLSSGLIGLDEIDRDKYSIRFDTRLGIRQPLEAFYSFNYLQSSLKQASLYYERSNKRLQRAELDIIYEVSSAFYDLVSASENEKNAHQTFKIQEEETVLAQNKYKAGVIPEVEALQMEIDLAEQTNNLDIAKADRIASENFLKQLLTVPLSDSLVLETDLSYGIVTVDIEKAIDFGLKNRLEIREREIDMELDEISIKRQRVDGHITGAISAYYDLIGVGEDTRDVPVRTTFDYAWNEMRRRPGNRGFALQVFIPLWDWGVNKAEVSAAKANLRKSKYSLENEMVSVEREIRNTVLRFKSSLRRLQLLEKNVEVAEKSMAISRSRFANGDINSQALALDRQRLSQAYKSRLEAFTSYKLLIADLARKTFYDFEHDRPLIDE